MTSRTDRRHTCTQAHISMQRNTNTGIRVCVYREAVVAPGVRGALARGSVQKKFEVGQKREGGYILAG